MFKVDFILQAFTAENEEFLKSFVDRAGATEESAANFEEPGTEPTSSKKNAKPSVETDVQNVLDILPHLERQFVVKLLSRYENAEQAIAAVLEGNLPPDLDGSNPETGGSPEKHQQPEESNIEQVTKLLDDIGIDQRTTIIIKGDKRQPMRQKNVKKVLDDKTHVREWKSRYEELAYVPENYEDEYDDSYDAMAESETKSVNQHLKHSGFHNAVNDDDSESDDSDGPGNGRDTKRDFCENPEAVRERYAQMRNNRYPQKPQPPSV